MLLLLLLLVCCLSGCCWAEECRGDGVSTVCPNFKDAAGPWYLGFWGVPDSLSNTSRVQCIRYLAVADSRRSVDTHGTLYLNDGSTQNTALQIKMNKISDNCCTHTLITNGMVIPTKLFEFNKFKFAIGTTKIQGKEYLLAYIRDTKTLQECNYAERLEKYKTKNDANPGYTFDPKACDCVD